MSRAHHTEMASVQRRQLSLTQTLHNCQHSRIDKPNAKVGISLHQLGHSLIVGGSEFFDLVRPGRDVRQEGGECRWSDQVAEVVDLDEHRRRDDSTLGGLPQQCRTRHVLVVAAIEGTNKRACVDYERGGLGTKSPSPARRARSPRPDAPTPIERGVGDGDPASRSRSSASRNTCAMLIPRSDARARARSKSSASAWITILFTTS
jgi:hypothetical protein